MVSSRGVRRNRFNIIGIAQGPRPAREPDRLQRAALPGTSTGSRLQWDMGMFGGKLNLRCRTGNGLRRWPLAAVLALALPLGGCFSETYQKGYVVPEGALEQIPIGASQEQVLILMGTPSTVATVSGEVFYYISQRAERRVAFMPQAVVDQRVVAVYFDRNRRVERLANYGMRDGRSSTTSAAPRRAAARKSTTSAACSRRSASRPPRARRTASTSARPFRSPARARGA